MVIKLILGLASIFTSWNSGSYYIEEELTLQKGINEIQAPAEWNAVTILSKNHETLPKIWYEDLYEGFQIWEHPDLNPGQNIETESWILKLLSFDNPRTSIRIKTETSTTVIIQFYNTESPLDNLIAQSSLYDIDFGNFKFSDELLDGTAIEAFRDGTNLGYFSKIESHVVPKYITRKGWGADESLRIWKPSRGFSNFFRSFAPEAKKLPVNQRPTIVQRKNDKGQRFTWPIEKNKTIKKIIIHHTGEYIKNVHRLRRDPPKHMRAIYAYHTLSRKWGDIGYNFVIDKKGNIYEGRAGGPKTVGAHTAFYNTGTIGIALIGNFNYEEPTEEQLKVLSLFSAYLSDQYNIKPEGITNFLDIESANITGHQFVSSPGHSTSCPGKHFVKRLPKLREDVSKILSILRRNRDKLPSGLDFLNQSSNAPKVQRYLPRFTRKEKKPLIASKNLIKKEIISRLETKTINLTLENNSNKDWAKGVALTPIDLPTGLVLTNFKSIEPIPKNSFGVFRARARSTATPNGMYHIKLDPKFLKDLFFSEEDRIKISLPIQVSGSSFVDASSQIRKKTNVSTQSVSKRIMTKLYSSSFREPIKTLEDDPIKKVKVKLASFNEKYAKIKSNSNISLWNKGRRFITIPANTTIDISTFNDSLKINVGEKKWILRNISLKTDGIFELINYNRGLGKTTKYNKFRNKLNIHTLPNKDLLIVNELPIEEYLWGLAEEPKKEPTAKKHAIHVLARSYAYVYSGERRKFKTSLYDLEDDPRTSQFYLGYDWEKSHPEQIELIAETAGEVLIHRDTPVIGPYFTQSAGKSSGKWYSQYPWAKVQNLPYDEGLIPLGHTVGLSGNSARVLAEKGKNYKEIIDYFFSNIEVEKIY